MGRGVTLNNAGSARARTQDEQAAPVPTCPANVSPNSWLQPPATQAQIHRFREFSHVLLAAVSPVKGVALDEAIKAARKPGSAAARIARSYRSCAALAEHANGGGDSRLDRACACLHRGRRHRARQAQCEGIAGAALVTGALTFICVNGRVLVRLPPEMLSCNTKAASAAGAIPRPRPPNLGADGAPIAQESHDALFDRVESASRLPAPLR